mgnify:CR=1 FL=1
MKVNCSPIGNRRGDFASAPAKPMFTSRPRNEVEKAVLRAICETDVCGSHRAGRCHAARCCGGSLPVETILNLDTTHCPKNYF